MGRHETATVLVQVLPVQDPPVAIKDQVVTTRNTEVVSVRFLTTTIQMETTSYLMGFSNPLTELHKI